MKSSALADRNFIEGYLAACQNLVTQHGEKALAKELMRDSRIPEVDLLAVQRESGYETRAMNRMIREVFQVK